MSKIIGSALEKFKIVVFFYFRWLGVVRGRDKTKVSHFNETQNLKSLWPMDFKV